MNNSLSEGVVPPSMKESCVTIDRRFSSPYSSSNLSESSLKALDVEMIASFEHWSGLIVPVLCRI